MGGWSLVLLILVMALLGFALLIAAVVLVLRFSQRWIDQYYARKGEGRRGPSAGQLYMDSLREKKR